MAELRYKLVMLAGVEKIWVDTQDLLIGVIYNPPSRSQRDFIDEFETSYIPSFCLRESVWS